MKKLPVAPAAKMNLSQLSAIMTAERNQLSTQELLSLKGGCSTNCEDRRRPQNNKDNDN